MAVQVTNGACMGGAPLVTWTAITPPTHVDLKTTNGAPQGGAPLVTRVTNGACMGGAPLVTWTAISNCTPPRGSPFRFKKINENGK